MNKYGSKLIEDQLSNINFEKNWDWARRPGPKFRLTLNKAKARAYFFKT